MGGSASPLGRIDLVGDCGMETKSGPVVQGTEQAFPKRQAGGSSPPRPAISTIDLLEQLLKRYLDNHCSNADAEGMSALCECKLCLETRAQLGM